LIDTLTRIRELAAAGDVRISDHGYDELAADGLYASEVLLGLASAELLEDYPTYRKGPCVLLLQADGQNRPVHAVWGIPAGSSGPAVLVTAYPPDPDVWEYDFRRRRP
jgi:Domain of unknown function (DUF4258)